LELYTRHQLRQSIYYLWYPPWTTWTHRGSTWRPAQHPSLWSIPLLQPELLLGVRSDRRRTGVKNEFWKKTVCT